MGLLICFLFSNLLQARVFNLANENFAPYFRGSIGLSSIGKSAYEHSSGTTTVFSEEPDYNYSGEAGFLFASPRLGFTLGIEFLTSQKMSIAGTNTSGTELMDLESQVKATILKGGVLFFYKSTNMYRGYVGFNGGFANLKLQNEYQLTTDGTSLYSLTTVSEQAVAQAIMYELIFGFEFNLADTTTMMIEGGYRYLSVNDWEYDGSGTNFLGSYTEGGSVLNHDGTKRQSNLSGWILAIGFRFYID